MMNNGTSRCARAFAIALIISVCFSFAVFAEGKSIEEARALLQREGNLTLIPQIQSAAHLSPLNRERVSRVPGIVTAIIPQRGFFMQSPMPDDRTETSEGIYVNSRKVRDVAVGDLVILDDAKVDEYYVGGASSGTLSVTRLKLPDITVIASGFALPEPVVIGRSGRTQPTEIISDDANGNAENSPFDPDSDGMDFYESLEGMLVTINDVRSVGTIHTAYGEIHVVPDDGIGASAATKRGGLVLRPGDFNPERIVIDLIENPNIAPQPVAADIIVGDRFDGPITGVLDYSFDVYKILPIHTVPPIIRANLPRETTDLAYAGRGRSESELSVAAFNVLNLAGDDPEERFPELAETITVALGSPDLIVLSEIQDSNGAYDDGTVSSEVTTTLLIEAIVAGGGPEYDYVDIPPENNKDGGEPGGNIRVGFLFDPARLTLVSGEQDADPLRTVAAVPSSKYGVELAPNPGRVGVDNNAFVASRKPLAAHFTFGGKSLYVIGAHLNSKSGDGKLFGRTQPPIFGSEVKRTRQADSIAAFIGDITSIDSDAYVIAAGDFNDFWFSSPVVMLKDAGMRNLVELMPESERYTYVYMGNSQTLDHILVSDALFEATAPAVDIVHRYAEYLFGVRQSDHDPVHAVLRFAE